MRRHRTIARVLSLAAIVGLTAGPAAARLDPGPAPKRAPSPGKKAGGDAAGKRIIFPILGTSRYSDSFSAPRPQGMHGAIDIMAPRKALAVAAEAGRVKFWTASARAGCMLYLYGESGTTYLYIHLNNDLTMGNDNRGACGPGVSYAPGLRSGAKVAAGEPIGFVGNSGDANGTETHVHFEMERRDGSSFNPFTYLNRAWRLLFAAPRKGETSLWLKGNVLAREAKAFKVQVNSLGVRATGLKLNGISRPVSLSLSPFTVIENAVGRQGDSRATVWTEVAPVTLDALLGKPGAITAERILLSR